MTTQVLLVVTRRHTPLSTQFTQCIGSQTLGQKMVHKALSQSIWWLHTYTHPPTHTHTIWDVNCDMSVTIKFHLLSLVTYCGHVINSTWTSWGGVTLPIQIHSEASQYVILKTQQHPPPPRTHTHILTHARTHKNWRPIYRPALVKYFPSIQVQTCTHPHAYSHTYTYINTRD